MFWVCFKNDKFITKWDILVLVVMTIFALQSCAVVTTFLVVKRQCWNEKVSVKVCLEFFPFQYS